MEIMKDSYGTWVIQINGDRISIIEDENGVLKMRCAEGTLIVEPVTSNQINLSVKQYS